MERYPPEGTNWGPQPHTLETLRKAARENSILESRAMLCDAEHNLIVHLDGALGIIPRAEAALGIGTGGTREVAILSRVGKPVCYKVVKIEQTVPPRALLSRRLAQEEALFCFLENRKPGDIISARITHLETFGAFVDIGCGIASLIGIENISVSRIAHPSDRFSVGQDIWAVVSGIDRAARRVSLTHKELLGTWSENAGAFSPGQTVTGVVRSIEEYGAFIELAPNLSGLSETRPGLREGQRVSVYIKSILPERMKVKLSLVDVWDEPAPKLSQADYFLREGHLRRWSYSPACCADKKIETVFDPVWPDEDVVIY